MQSTPVSQRSPVLRLWWIVLGLALTLTLLAAVTLWQLRREAIQSQARELGLLSLAVTDEVGRGLQGAEEGLHALRSELRDGRLPLQGAAAVRALHTRAVLMPLVQTLWLVDAQGRSLSASDSTPAPELSSFAPALAQLESNAVAVSRPFVDKDLNKPRVALAVRFDGAKGQTGGWILAAMPATVLLGAFSAASPAADARMVVFRSDGVRLAGSRRTTPPLDEASMAQRLATQQSMELRRFRDGSDHLVGLHSLPRYGLKVMLTRDLEVLLAGWRQTVQLTLAAFALVLAMLLVSVYFVRRADRRRASALDALQSQIARSSKLESLGTLAGGVAHDFNNVLAAIVGFGEMAQDAATPDSAQARHLERVLQAAARGKALVERILSFSRGGARRSVVFELEPIVDEALSLLSASLRPGLVLERRLEAPQGRLRGDPTRAFEAVMNLCTNALQAMPDGGMLSVQLQRRQVGVRQVLSHSRIEPGNYLAMTVVDEGTGITSQDMEHLFEPFFTTRAAHAGTGLGLAVVHGVVAEFGGGIDVQSSAGNGARFTLYLPECADALDHIAAPQKSAPRGTGQALLVVDDEAELMALLQETLTGLGYRAVGFSDARAALEALREQPQAFSAVITDELMPGLSGTELTQALRQFAPQLPVLLVSGFGGALLASRAAAAGVTQVLSKPLKRADLARALAQVLA